MRVLQARKEVQHVAERQLLQKEIQDYQALVASVHAAFDKDRLDPSGEIFLLTQQVGIL